MKKDDFSTISILESDKVLLRALVHILRNKEDYHLLTRLDFNKYKLIHHIIDLFKEAKLPDGSIYKGEFKAAKTSTLISKQGLAALNRLREIHDYPSNRYTLHALLNMYKKHEEFKEHVNLKFLDILVKKYTPLPRLKQKR